MSEYSPPLLIRWPKYPPLLPPLKGIPVQYGGYVYQRRKEILEMPRERIMETEDIASSSGIVPKGGSYFPSGVWPGEVEFTDHSVISEEMLMAMIDLVSDTRLNCFIIADIPFNRLKGKKAEKGVTSYINHIKDGVYLKDEAKAAIATGVREKLFLEAIRDTAIQSIDFMEKVLGISFGDYKRTRTLTEAEREGFRKLTGVTDIDEHWLMKMRVEVDDSENNFYKPVVLMSQIVEQYPEINENFEILANIPEDNERFWELAWNCVPRHLKREVRAIGKRRREGYYLELQSPNNKGVDEKAAAREAMGYVLFQTAFVIFWGGTKYSYGGEEHFDKLVQFCFEKEGETGLKIANILHHSGKIPQFYDPKQDSKYKFKSAVPYARSDLEKAEEGESISFVGRRGIISSIKSYLRIFANAFNRIKKRSTLNSKEKIKLVNLQILKMLIELVIQLMKDETFKEDLNDCRIMDLLKGNITFDQWRADLKDFIDGGPLPLPVVSYSSPSSDEGGEDHHSLQAQFDMELEGVMDEEFEEYRVYDVLEGEVEVEAWETMDGMGSAEGPLYFNSIDDLTFDDSTLSVMPLLEQYLRKYTPSSDEAKVARAIELVELIGPDVAMLLVWEMKQVGEMNLVKGIEIMKNAGIMEAEEVITAIRLLEIVKNLETTKIETMDMAEVKNLDEIINAARLMKVRVVKESLKKIGYTETNDETDPEMERISETRSYEDVYVELSKFGSVVEELSELMPNGEMKMMNVLLNLFNLLAHILYKDYNKNKEIASHLWDFFNVIVYHLSGCLTLNFTIEQALRNRKK